MTEQARGATGRLTGKVAIVTGAGSSGPSVGTGKAISVLFARAGAKVCLVDRDADRAEETERLIADEGGDAYVVRADVTRPSDCASVVESVLAQYHQLNIVVNNVGIEGGWPVEVAEESDWDRVLGVNLKSAFLMCKQAIPRLREAGGGAIINISSIAALQGRGGSAYGAAKAGMLALTRDVAVAYGRDLIRANAIAPGHIHTAMSTQDPQLRERRRRIAPLGFEGDAWDVAWTAVFLASDESRFVNGVVIPVDGGVTQILADQAYTLVTRTDD